jgi:hypothetical protein
VSAGATIEAVRGACFFWRFATSEQVRSVVGDRIAFYRDPEASPTAAQLPLARLPRVLDHTS